MKIFKNLWEYWKKFGKLLGKIQTTIILAIIYYLIITPVGLIKILFKSRKKQASYWINIPAIDHTLEKAYEQY